MSTSLYVDTTLFGVAAEVLMAELRQSERTTAKQINKEKNLFLIRRLISKVYSGGINYDYGIKIVSGLATVSNTDAHGQYCNNEDN